MPTSLNNFKAVDVLNPNPSREALSLILQALPAKTRERLFRQARSAQRRVYKTGGRVQFEFGGVTYQTEARLVLPFLRGIQREVDVGARPDEFDQTTARVLLLKIAADLEAA